jgi:hypothetical protein
VLLVLGLAAVLTLPGVRGCSNPTLPNYVPQDDDDAPKDTNSVGMTVFPADPGDLLV